ncbi:MAG: DUF4386 domain-containing protein [Gemmatimonadaceae bacterium]
MGSIRGTARLTGLFYLMMGLPGPFILMYIPRRFIVSGDAAATAAQILDAERLYRLGMLAGLISSVGFLLLVQSLYTLLRDVDRQQARMMVMFVLMAVGLGFVDMILQSAPLVVLRNAEALSAFTAPQRDALAYSFLRLRTNEMQVAASLWGLWLLPFGVLVWKSGFIPRVIGVLLIVGGVAYLAGSITYMVFPEHFRTVTRFTLPLGAPGEIAIMVWLLVRGHRFALQSRSNPVILP